MPTPHWHLCCFDELSQQLNLVEGGDLGSLARTVVLLLVAINLGLGECAQSHAQTQEDPEQGWAETNVGFDLIKFYTREITPCKKSVENFFSCLELVAGMGAQLEPKQVLLPKDVQSLYPEIRYLKVKDMGEVFLAIVTSYGAQESRLKIASKEKEKFNLLRQAAASMFKRKAGINFEKLVAQLLRQIPASISRQRAIGMAVNRMLKAKDAHAYITPIHHFESSAREPSSVFTGIGIFFSQHLEGIQILSVKEGGSAEKAGLLADDIVLSIDGVSMAGLSLRKAMSVISGPEDTVVKLKIRRRVDAENQEFELGVRRIRIAEANLKFKTFSDFDGSVEYIKLASFMDDSACHRISEHLKSLSPDAKGIVLDLRNNSGGFLDQAICIAGLFIGPETVVIRRKVRGGVTQPEDYELKSDSQKMTSLPLVILIDHISASASEVVAGAIRDHKRGWLLGTRTAGKGTVQTGKPLFYSYHSPELFIFETSHRFYSPLGEGIQGVGLRPNFEVFSDLKSPDENRKVMRLMELVPNTLPPEPVKPALMDDEENHLKLKSCMDQGLAEKIFMDRFKPLQPRHPDLQLLKAQELLSCARSI